MKRLFVFVLTVMMAGSLSFAQDTGADKDPRSGKKASKSKGDKIRTSDDGKTPPPKSDRTDADRKKPQTGTNDKPSDPSKRPRTEASDKKPAGASSETSKKNPRASRKSTDASKTEKPN